MGLISASRREWDSMEPTLIEVGVDFGAPTSGEILLDHLSPSTEMDALSELRRDHSQAQLGDTSLQVDAGKTPVPLSCEATELLRFRLKCSAVISLIGLVVFFLRTVFFEEILITALRSISPIISLGCLGMLAWPGPISLQRLRRIEWLLFGSLYSSVVILQITFLLKAAQLGDPVQQVAVLYAGTVGLAVIMLVQGMMIPHSLRGVAAKMLLPIAILILSLFIVRNVFPSVAAVINETRAGEIGLTLLVSGLVSIFGSMVVSDRHRDSAHLKRLGQYRLKQQLGQGGMGQVFLAEHQLLKRPCAIKIIHPGQGADPSALLRFEREVQTTARLSHWNTIEIFDYGHTDDGTFYYVMEYMRGLSLLELVNRYGPLPQSRAVHFLNQTCWALQEAHNQGLIHRDLKPANIFAAKRGGVFDVTKLFDFGLVVERREREGFHPKGAPDVSSPFAGSPLYMSPEQVAGRPLDGRTDVYSLGAVGYYLLTGRPPFDGNSAWRVMQAHANDPVELPSLWNPAISPDLEGVILRALSKRPDQRYGSPKEMAEALLACRDVGRWTYEHAAVWWREHAQEIDASLLEL